MSFLRASYCGRSIRDILWLDPILSIRFQDRETRCMVGILSAPGPFCYVAIDNPLAGCSARRVFEDIYGGKFAGVNVAETDCILRLAISSERGPHELSLSLFGNAGSAVLTREGARIVSLGRGGDRGRNQSGRRNVISALAGITSSEMRQYLQASPADGAIVAGLEPEMIDAFALPADRCDMEGLLRFRDGLLEGSQSFCLVARKGIHRAFPMPATSTKSMIGKQVMGPFTSGIAAGRYIGEQLLETTFVLILDRRIRPLRKRISAKKNLRSRLLEQQRQAQRHPQLRRETEALAAYQTRIPPGSASIQLPNPYNTQETLNIELDPAVPIKTQIKKRFQKVSKLERSGQKITSRLEAIDREIQSLHESIEIPKTAPSFANAMQRLDQSMQVLGLRSPQSKSPASAEQGKTYRRYDIDKDWFVLVGRNNRENDLITFHIASPNDWWFHAQSVPGSHVVLKSKGTAENPPERVLASTASIAAYYSKSRHASLVPVIYTRRKYVRKPRKALPGKVICEREKTIFAEPGLPQSLNTPPKE
jgi:hypothetical protein